MSIHTKHVMQMKQKQFDEFRATILPMLNADKRFSFVGCGEFTGYPHGALIGAVASSNDLSALRKIYLKILTNHPAPVVFKVNVEEQIQE
ncbi:MAG TPA: hypothetical protein VIK53_09290 [Verrucomicrobiae bacterium]